ncbi:ArnT family glycosyltransferase [Paludisphaera rhizosphaerae]|uniref:ArnT family glycosyltransferase n=1 Tax=Paludisphaera rhizosphaerae TaxID=2711216 RepID=UPI001F0D29F4|nr:glycosyltransferase family 39 protein [Paludisphaera rhizosphaerae]
MFIASLLVGAATLVLMLATEPRLAIAWDESYSLGREARLRLWFQALRDPTAFAASWKPPVEELVQQEGAPPPPASRVDSRWKLLTDPDVLAWFWPFAREEPHGHPPFYALLGLIGDVLTPGRSDLARGRLGPILLFSFCAGALFHFVGRRWGWWAAAASAGAWVLHPQMFGYGHYATYDGPLTCVWLLAVMAFAKAVEQEPAAGGRRAELLWAVVLGAVLGCAMANKLTGWFLPLPFLVWAVIYRSGQAFRTLAFGVCIGLAVAYLLQPPWWSEPIAGPLRFFRSNLTRDQTIRIEVQFLGTIYQTPKESLPWFNTIVLTAFTTPVGFLLLALAGAWRAVARWKVEPILLLFLGHWLFLLALRAMPHVPGHDGVRLFLPAFGMLALLAGPGAEQIRAWFGRFSRWIVGASLLEGALSVAVMLPVPLSYYSPLVGGLPGASKLGMEPTYYWDALDADALAWLREKTDQGRTIRFSTFPTSWLYLRRTGDLPQKLAPIDPGQPQWYVFQNRPGAMHPWDRILISRTQPAYVVTKLGVPLVWVYPYEAVEQAMREVGR